MTHNGQTFFSNSAYLHRSLLKREGRRKVRGFFLIPWLDIIPHFYNIRIIESREAVIALAALAQESRLSIFRLLVQVGPEGIPVGRIGEELEVAPATLSFHLKELHHAGLISSRKAGLSSTRPTLNVWLRS